MDVRPTALTLAEAAQMMRQAVKDKSYRATPVGVLVGRYIRWFRNEWGATAATVTVDDLRDVIDLWADREARTRAKVTSVIRAFWTWAEDQDQVPFSPA